MGSVKYREAHGNLGPASDVGGRMNGVYDGPYGECSEQMYKLWQLLKAKGITLYNGFPDGWFFFDVNHVRYEVTDCDGCLRMVWTKRYDRDVTPCIAVEIATSRAVLD